MTDFGPFQWKTETKGGFTVLCIVTVIIMRSKRSDTSSGKIKGFSGSVLWTALLTGLSSCSFTAMLTLFSRSSSHVKLQFLWSSHDI